MSDVPKYGGMEAEYAKRLKELESGNSRLKRLLAEAHLDIEALKVGGKTLAPQCKREPIWRMCELTSANAGLTALRG